MLYSAQIFSVGRTLREHGLTERELKSLSNVEILALCTQKCGGVDEVSHSLSVEPIGHPDDCRHICNVTAVTRSRRQPRPRTTNTSRGLERE